MKKRHFAFLISDLSAGGAQRVAAILCAHWIRQGHDVTMITFENETQTSFYDLPPQIKIIRLGLAGGSSNLLKSIPANLKRIATLRRIYKQIKPDLLITFMPESNILGILSASLVRAFPVLVSERSDPVIIPMQKVWRLLRRLSYPLAQTVICQTPKAAGFFTWHRNVVALPNPVTKPLTEDTQKVNLPKKFIVAIGRLGHEKGIDILVSAFIKMSPDHPDHNLVLIGKGDQEDRLKEQVSAAGLKDRVHFLGEIKNPFSIAGKAELYVIPSRFEGFPNALCEAMICGLPAIASEGAAGALPFLQNGQNALLFETGNADDLAGKMRAVLSDQDLSENLSTNAQKIATELSPETVCAQWDKVLEETMINHAKNR